MTRKKMCVFAAGAALAAAAAFTAAKRIKGLYDMRERDTPVEE